MQAAGEDGVDDLHHNTHDVNEVGRLGAQSLFVNDAVCILCIGWVCPAVSPWRTIMKTMIRGFSVFIFD